MAQNKHERGLNFFSTLSDDTARETAKYLSLKDIAALARVSESSRLLFQPILNDAKAVHPLLAAVVTGDPDALCLLVNADPALLFTKGQIKDPAGQVFYDVSPYQLMIFLCDDDMKSRIMPFTRLSEQMARKRQVQYAEINIGGADLVKMDRDPMLLPFEDITRFTTSYVFMGQRKEVTYPLLENPDGILYYKNPTSNQAQFYYANQDTRTVACIEPRIHSQQEQAALDRLEDSLADMEDLSSRRLSNDEHKFIESIMQHTLVRKGLQYERDGVRYCDHRIEFRIVHAYRQCLRLYRNNQWDVGDEHWCHGVGKAQSEVMWILQRMCENNRTIMTKRYIFQRDFSLYKGFTYDRLTCCVDGKLIHGLGSDFAVYRGGDNVGRSVMSWKSLWWQAAGGTFDSLLADVHFLIEDAKANVVESQPDQNLGTTCYGKRP